MSYLESDNAALMSQLREFVSVTSPPRKPVRWTVGPYVQLTGYNEVVITHVFPTSVEECPEGTVLQYSGESALWCEIRLAP